MKKPVVFTALFVFLLSCASFGNELIWQEIAGGYTDIKTVLVEPENPKVIYIGSRQGVFKTWDGSKTWRNILSLRGANRTINFLSFDWRDKNSIYAATENGLFFSRDCGRSWKRIFRGRDYFEKYCTTIAVSPSAIYLGTKGGLFISRDRGRSWQRQDGDLGKSHIWAIAYNVEEPACIYVVCAESVYKTADSGKSWERVFTDFAAEAENGNATEENSEDQGQEGYFSGIRYISLDPNNLNYLYLATSAGVYLSRDRGKNWQRLSDYGLLSRDVRFLWVSSESCVYAVTKSGIFLYRQERWQELSLRLVAEEVYSLAFDEQGNLYAACDKGLFKGRTGYINNAGSDGILLLYYKDEPGINEVQQAAIKHAEVEPEKIQRWRKQAAKKALLPQVSVGVDRNTTDLWHWEGGSTTKVDDDILRRGRDSVEWDVTLTWNLGELIYNDDQTSIDVRSRLMVELRDDILDEVTKLYFERIRVKMELDNLSIEDRKKRFEKELRLKELAAYLDALTGGYFSQRIKTRKEG